MLFSVKLSNHFYINAYRAYFWNSPLKEKALALSNNLPLLLLPNCFCLGIRHPLCMTGLSPALTGLKGEFVTNSGSPWMWKRWHAVKARRAFPAGKCLIALYGLRLGGKRSEVLLLSRAISLASLPSTLKNPASRKTKPFVQKHLAVVGKEQGLKDITWLGP